MTAITARTDNELRQHARRMRANVLRMGASEAGAHVGGSLSCVDIMAVLHLDVMRGDDRFILSKGHASAALYAVLVERGLLDESELDTYAVAGGRLGGHPSTAVPEVLIGTGSLGHGLSVAAGMALGTRWDRGDQRIFVLLGDGELQEGSVWEAAMFAGQNRLGALTAIVDRNGWQLSGPTMGLEPLANRFRTFGWSCVEVDGHDVTALRTILPTNDERPRVVIAHTVKGCGVGFLEDKVSSHYTRLSPSVLARATRALGQS
jgi:transketolase